MARGGPAGAASRRRGAAPRRPDRPRSAAVLGLPLRRWRTLALPAALLGTAAVHAPALRTFFAQDDITFLLRARGLEPTPWSLARPLSEGWAWRLLHALFGLNPLPYHLLNFALHLACTTLVYAIGRRLLRGQVAAAAAAVLFGVSSIAFTPLHWASALVMLLVAAFSLAAFWLYLLGADRGDARLLWLGAILGLAALLSKESAILFPLLLLVAWWRLETPRPAWRVLIPQTVTTLAYAAAFVATLGLVHYAASPTYAMRFSPLFVAQNLMTYLNWCAALLVPARDVMAAMDPAAWRLGLPVALAVVLALWTQRGAARHPEEVGAAWFLTQLLPVVPLAHHTYLYYMYPVWVGACWLLAGLGQRAVARWGKAAGWVAAALLLGFTAVEYRNVRARESAVLGPFPADKTIREAQLLGNAVAGLRGARVQPGARIAFVNPAPPLHFAVADPRRVPNANVSSYVPVEGAMRHGQAVRLFLPGVEYLGFARRLPREWEDAEVFLYRDDGGMRALGRGSRALAELGYFTLRTRQWAAADSMFQRSRALGDTLADATFGLIITSGYLGRQGDERRYAEEFLRRWPDDARAATVAQGLRRPPGDAAR